MSLFKLDPQKRILPSSIPRFEMILQIITTCCIMTGVFISFKMRYENVSEKEPISADEGATKRTLRG
jgi:hypothetical protein